MHKNFIFSLSSCFNMTTFRFFVSNLPTRTTKKDLKRLFKNYGTIENIELKIKDNLMEDGNKQIIAFVTLQIGAKEAQHCIKELNYEKLHDQQIKVVIAKESFLERLKREREIAKIEQSLNFNIAKPLDNRSNSLNNTIHNNKRKRFDIHEDLKEDEVASELMITKKRAASSMHNGKIVIQASESNNAPLHVIQHKKPKKRQPVDVRGLQAEIKRKESLNKMKQNYQQKKSTIQQSLKDLGKCLASKKIKFSDNESESETQSNNISDITKKAKLFPSDDEGHKNDSEEEFLKLKPFLVGRKGAKLAQLQSKQSLDTRFRMDLKFLDSEDDNDANEDNENNEDGDERKRQINILEQVVGCTIKDNNNMQEMKKHKKMLRYDPDNEAFEQHKTSAKKKKNLLEKHTEHGKIKNPVSKKVFYVVTDTLQESLKKPCEDFSLLSMFNNTQYIEQRQQQLKQLGQAKIWINNNKLEKSLTSNPFTYDSSATESEDEYLVEEITTVCNNADNNKQTKILKESFFLEKNDKRLKEGANFFHFEKHQDTENYEEVRQHLKEIIKKKINKTKKSYANAGYKAAKKKRRY